MGSVAENANNVTLKWISTSYGDGGQEAGKKISVVFVLGEFFSSICSGPGSGKGTQCANIVQNFGYVHLSAGDLLRAEIKSGSENGYILCTTYIELFIECQTSHSCYPFFVWTLPASVSFVCYRVFSRTMIQNMIKEGKIVPAEVTIKLLQKAIQESDNDKFLIDGFPRNEENRAAFESITGIVPEFVLFFDCSEEEMEKRLLETRLGVHKVWPYCTYYTICVSCHGLYQCVLRFWRPFGGFKGREDDNIDTIRKRFRVYMESSLPVIHYYDSLGKVRKIDAGKPIEAVFEDVKAVFQKCMFLLEGMVGGFVALASHPLLGEIIILILKSWKWMITRSSFRNQY
ncbi:LOW QUALITY PROTEIN: hypothetical protein Cgig2_029488 [Carnegiea gigantea]|uniref:adenylate kinase n=1 Tax=Carnegiea gigantea TaxID=171969 RepID=A0A9Q1KLU8_9CARY|nr:LOW QUALITY PROTEIN: hypothetical protein Cgig2_029488 [Carnegiea gigantea]